MISEFQQLAQKVSQLVAVAAATRAENDSMRRELVELSAGNAALSARIREANERVTAVLAKLPADLVLAEEESE